MSRGMRHGRWPAEATGRLGPCHRDGDAKQLSSGLARYGSSLGTARGRRLLERREPQGIRGVGIRVHMGIRVRLIALVAPYLGGAGVVYCAAVRAGCFAHNVSRSGFKHRWTECTMVKNYRKKGRMIRMATSRAMHSRSSRIMDRRPAPTWYVDALFSSEDECCMFMAIESIW